MTSLTAGFANDLFRHDTRQTADDVVQQADTRGPFDATFIHYGVAIQPLVNHAFLFREMIMKSFDFGNSCALTKIDTCRR
jgi:hypothetical protein